MILGCQDPVVRAGRLCSHIDEIHLTTLVCTTGFDGLQGRSAVIGSVQLAASTVIGKPFNLLTIDTVDVEPYSFEGFLITSMPKPLVCLLDDIIDVVIEGRLTKW
jgi:hypothetical protein